MKSTVLIVEDDPIIGEMISMIMEEHGLNVISLGDTGRVRDKLHNNEADLVMLDIKLDGENGKDMCRYIKQQDDLKHIPVIFVSASHDIEQATEICGADDFIRKPFDLGHIVEKVNKYTRAVA